MKRPWKNRLIVKFFLSYLVVVLLLFAFFYPYSGAIVKNFYISSLSKKMEQEARIVSRLLPAGLEGEALDKICRELAQDLKSRVTVIALDGRVQGDSDQRSLAMENHGTRPEVVEALSRGGGRSIRYSTTVQYEMLYQAILQREKDQGRIVRISVSLGTVEEAIGSIRRAILLGLFLISGLGLLLAFFFSRHLGRRVRRMAEFSQNVSKGFFLQEPLRVREEDELSTLENNLNEMSRSLQEKIKGIVAEKEKVDSILRCMIEGVLVVDTQGRLILLNQKAQKMFNLPPTQSLQGASLLEVSRHPEMKRLTEEVLACDCSTECFSKEISLDEGRWFRVNAVSLRDGDNRPLGYILVFHDITELKRLETVRADFVANVSHELRTPVTAIRGYAETLLRTPPADPSDTEQFLSIIQRHSERLGRLIDDLLTLSDLESGKIHLARENVKAAELIERVVEIFQDQAKKKGVSLSHAIEFDLPPILGDPDRLQQLLINLVDNAIKYTPAGGQVKITACQALFSEKPAHPMVEIAVTDTGCGIPEKDLPRITERFYRVEKARSRELGGTGLGLAIVKHIVQAHEGFLKIGSQVQKGTTVRVFLPAANDGKELKEILFLCTANSCRSQMAEGFARVLAPKEIRVYSAGTEPKKVHPLAIKVMEELGIDISDQRSKGLEAVPLEKIDLVVTLCGEAAESCPTLAKMTERLHWPLPDPASARGDEDSVLKTFREVRDEIRTRVKKLFFPSPI
ncbi:MAG: PAS domain-containing protein [Deltaproteobacteria bacterium]|nr:PAS domain-containing protein [Deltaproteobacteria bacterium]